MDERKKEDNNMEQTKEIFVFREPMVLLPILCLSLLSGISSNIDQTRFFENIKSGQITDSIMYEIMLTLAPLPGVMLIAFISEMKGRKLAFVLLFALCVLSAILSFIPYQQPWAIMENFVAAGLRGVVSPVVTVAICEYCSPKHRFAYLVASEVLSKLGFGVTNILKAPLYVAICMLIIALVCLGSVNWWPESPYWLRSQTRYQESREALLRLRKEGDDALKEFQAFETARRRRTPKLFCLTLLIAFLTVTVAQCAYAGQTLFTKLNRNVKDMISESLYKIIYVCVNPVVSLLIVLVSYKVQRKVVYLSTVIFSLALLYVIAIWASKVKVQENKSVSFHVTLFICNIFLGCGPYNLSLALLIEIIPRKYYTLISCISYLYFLSSLYFFSFLPLNHHGSITVHGFIFLFATLSLVVALILYCLIPETRDKHLLEIEQLCINRVYGENDQDHIGLQALSN